MVPNLPLDIDEDADGHELHRHRGYDHKRDADHIKDPGRHTSQEPQHSENGGINSIAQTPSVPWDKLGYGRPEDRSHGPLPHTPKGDTYHHEEWIGAEDQRDKESGNREHRRDRCHPDAVKEVPKDDRADAVSYTHLRAHE